MNTTVAPALRALLANFIDYAGLFPPAALALEQTVNNYHQYTKGDHAWMLRYIVVPASVLAEVPVNLDGQISLLGESDNNRAAALESKVLVRAEKPVYYELQDNEPALLGARLDDIKKSGCFAKIRTGGLKAEAIPSPALVAAFIKACAERKLAFKATAGLHHPVRAIHALTYESDAPQAVMHGFLNVLMAAAFAWHKKGDIEAIIAEMEGSAFSFDDRAHWRGESLSIEEIVESRYHFIHSVGSCSFDEPVNELQELRFLPQKEMIKPQFAQ